MIAFHNGTSPKTLNLSLKDTPAGTAAGISALFGEGQADVAGQQLRLVLPPQSFSVFLLQ